MVTYLVVIVLIPFFVLELEDSVVVLDGVLAFLIGGGGEEPPKKAAWDAIVFGYRRCVFCLITRQVCLNSISKLDVRDGFWIACSSSLLVCVERIDQGSTRTKECSAHVFKD